MKYIFMRMNNFYYSNKSYCFSRVGNSDRLKDIKIVGSRICLCRQIYDIKKQRLQNELCY